MMTESIQIEVEGVLKDHIRQQVGERRAYRTTEDYVRALILRDIQHHADTSEWLLAYLEPAMQADENEFVAVSAEDVIRRNQRR